MDLARMAWPDAQDALASARLALLPVGAVEQRGPQLPLATDWIIASRIASDAAQSGDRLLLPEIQIGVSVEHRQFWGTLSVSPEVLRVTTLSICRSVAGHGLTRMVLANGHGSNVAPLEEAARELRTKGIFAFVFNWWQSISSTLAELFPDPTAHAGSSETSLMLAIEPDLVRVDRLADADEARE
jgi:creatinine amidohydrolase